MCPAEEAPSQRNRMQREAGSSSSLEAQDRHHQAELGVDWLDWATLLGGVGGTEQQAEIGDSSADLRLTGAFRGTGTCQQSRMNTDHAGCFWEQVGGLEGGMT